MAGAGRQAVVRVGVNPPVPAVVVAQRQHVEHELAGHLGRVQPGQPGRDPVEHDDAADLVGDDHPIGQLIGEDQAPDRDRPFRDGPFRTALLEAARPSLVSRSGVGDAAPLAMCSSTSAKPPSGGTARK